jgi:hypothetical protein
MSMAELMLASGDARYSGNIEGCRHDTPCASFDRLGSERIGCFQEVPASKKSRHPRSPGMKTEKEDGSCPAIISVRSISRRRPCGVSSRSSSGHLVSRFRSSLSYSAAGIGTLALCFQCPVYPSRSSRKATNFGDRTLEGVMHLQRFERHC